MGRVRLLAEPSETAGRLQASCDRDFERLGTERLRLLAH
jgi:hypothetical protein